MANIKVLGRLQGENTSQYAYRVLYYNIINLLLAPGEALSEAEIASALSISRTPVREALSRLRDDFLVDIFPQKISRVSLLDLDLMCEGIEIRRVIETFVINSAVGHLKEDAVQALHENLNSQRYVLSVSPYDEGKFQSLDDEFHRIIYFSVGKQLSWNVVSHASQHYMRYLRLQTSDELKLETNKIHRACFAMHEELLAALLKDEPFSASEFCCRHIHNFTVLPNYEEYEKKVMEECRGYFVPFSQETYERLRSLRGGGERLICV